MLVNKDDQLMFVATLHKYELSLNDGGEFSYEKENNVL